VRINRQPQAVGEVSGTGLITPETIRPVASVGTPTPGLNSGRSDISGWEGVASGPVVLPPLSRGTVVGKLKAMHKIYVPWEVLVHTVERGTPGAYVARVVSRSVLRSS
jgi:hypothetical protein